MSLTRPVHGLALVPVAILVSALVVLVPQAAHAGRWAPAGSATITPGVQMLTEGAQCTANFVFTDHRRRVYVGYAAHCAGTGEATDTDGCTSGTRPLGTRVDFVRGASPQSDGTVVGRGRLVYSSWTTMQRLGTRDGDTCAANDFALVRVRRADVGRVNPSVPVLGGPGGLAQPPAAGSAVHSYGQSSLRPDTTLSPKDGVALGATNGGWGSEAFTVTPGIPGDSGSGFLDASGRAYGTLSTLGIAPLPGSNGLGSLVRELDYAQAHAGIRGLRLVRGTEPFAR